MFVLLYITSLNQVDWSVSKHRSFIHFFRTRENVLIIEYVLNSEDGLKKLAIHAYIINYKRQSDINCI